MRCFWFVSNQLHLRHHGHDCISNHQPYDCLLNSLFRRRSKKTSKLRVTGLCQGNSPGTGEFPAKMTSNAENVSIWWRHHIKCSFCWLPLSLNICWNIFICANFTHNNRVLFTELSLYIFVFLCVCVNWILIKTGMLFDIFGYHLVVSFISNSNPWWRHQMETFSASLAFCAGNSPVTGEFPEQRPVSRSFDVFFDLRLNKRLSKQSWDWWFETPSRPLWRHCNAVFECVLSDAKLPWIAHYPPYIIATPHFRASTKW